MAVARGVAADTCGTTVSCPSAAGTPSSPSASTAAAPEHHTGGYLHFDLGPQYLSINFQGQSIINRNAALGFGVAAGFAVAKNQTLGVHVFGSWLEAVDASQEGTPSTGVTVPPPASSSRFALWIGPQYTVWFLHDSYLSLTGGLASLFGLSSFTGGGIGWGGQIALGHEWWTTQHWALGAAFQFSFALNPGQGQGQQPDVTTLGASFGLSVTYN
jgi:hypothetical protein